jgi:uncharacterized protein YbgA (DUF1722 family)/uncharacterized protein YbbK (DUF523 family)
MMQAELTDRIFKGQAASKPGRLPRLGVSSCLMGQPVRFDGGHKNNRFISASLIDYMDFQPVCPEIESGMSVPRPTIQLRQKGDDIRLVMSKQPDHDLTEQMNTYAESKLDGLSHLDGYIFKKDSPSCGVFRVPVVINQQGYKTREGTGVFARAFMERYPLIPVEEEGRLNDTGLRENFIERVYAYRRWKSIPDPEHNVKGLIEFHARHKLMLMARGSHYYEELGRLVAGVSIADLSARREGYIVRFMEVMRETAPRRRQYNVLQHILGYLKNVLSSEDKQELLAIFKAYRDCQVPLITPITLLRHHLRVHPQPYINQQHYLKPCPETLALRSS